MGLPNHWICQICHEQTGGEGIIEIINANIDLGPIGSYPVRATEDVAIGEQRFRAEMAREKGVSIDKLVLTAAELVKLSPPTANNVLVIRHLRCTSDQRNQGYWFETSRAETPESWIAWAIHLGEKSWMGRQDVLHMLSFWWTHKGERPPV
jgi:hypothetical protein